jgi:NAD(P)-dependent dehydrogenase (short-subunit alcohol dehydrogenase family)
MHGRTVVITGASSGIGLETARALAGLGAKIVMVVRSKERGEAAIANIRGGSGSGTTAVPDAQIELVLADLYSLAEVRRAGGELRERFPKIDVLVNNAGLIHAKRELTVDGFEKTFALNHLAAFLLTYELRDAITWRIVTVSSWGHNIASFEWDDLATMNRWRGETNTYGVSKLCNIWFARESARRLRSAGRAVTSNAVHPGAVASNFGASGSWVYRVGTKLARPFLKTAAEGARTSVYAASSPDVEGMTGEYFVNERVTKPSKRARSDDDARRLWELSEKLCGVEWA